MNCFVIPWPGEQDVNGLVMNGAGMEKDVSRNILSLGGEHPQELHSQKQMTRRTQWMQGLREKGTWCSHN
jgi:hypothetical protein